MFCCIVDFGLKFYQEEKFPLVTIHAKLMDNCMPRNKAESDINVLKYVGTQDIMAQCYDCSSALNSCQVIMDLFSNNTHHKFAS